MKRNILYEIFFISGTLIFTLILFSLMQEEETLYFAASEVAFGSFLLLYFALGLIRQLWEKFKNLILNFSLVTVSILLTILLFNFIELVNEPSVVFSDNGVTIYPPLSSLPDTLDEGSSQKQDFISGIYLFCVVIISVIVLTMIKSIKNLKKLNLT